MMSTITRSFSAGSMTLDPALWSQLPDDLIHEVLFFVPVLELCKLRRVSKTWSNLIGSTRFGATYARRALHRHAYTPVIAMRCALGRSKSTHEGWCFLDLHSYKWFTVRDDHARLHPHHNSSTRPVAFINGGLVCRYVTPIDPSAILIRKMKGLTFAIIVYNPIGISLKELPSVSCHVKSRSIYSASVYPVLIPVVDDDTMTFKVFFINQYVIASSDPPQLVREEALMKIYDSSTQSWRDASNPFCVATRGVGTVSNTFVFQGFLYVQFGINRGYLDGIVVDFAPSLWRYNLATDAWENVNLILPNHLEVQLFASEDRLYSLGWTHYGPLQTKLEVCEITAPTMTLTNRFSLSKDEALELFDEPTRCEPTFEVVGAAFGDAVLLIAMKSQKVRVLDLESRMWSWVRPSLAWTRKPANIFDYEFEFTKMFANPITNMHLILPSSLWQQEAAGRMEAQRIHKAIMQRFTSGMFNPRFPTRGGPDINVFIDELMRNVYD